MIFRRKKQTQEETEKPVKKRHILRRIFKYVSLFLLLAIIGIAGFIGWATQSASGHAWLVATINKALGPEPEKDGLAFRITGLTGSVPGNFKFGLESHDKDGLWLRAPDNQFVWNLRELPGMLHLPLIRAGEVNVERLPKLPETPEQPEPSKPMTPADLRQLLQQAADFLGEKHWWLPGIKIDDLSAFVLLPQELLPSDGPQRLALDAALTMNFMENHANLGARAELKNALAAHIAAPSLNFDSASLNLNAAVAPKTDGIGADCEIVSEILNPVLETATLPPDFLGDAAQFSIRAQLAADTGETSPALEAIITGPALNAGHITLAGNGQWHTSAWNEGKFDGPMNYKLDLELAPPADAANSRLAPLRAPARLNLEARGDLPRLDAALNLDCAEIAQSGHTLTDTRISVSAKGLALPLDATEFHALENEHHIALKADTLVDRQKIALAADLFFQALGSDRGWRAGMRNLALDALGVQASGNIAALLPKDKKPGIDGELHLAVKNWNEINKILPDQELSGAADIRLLLSAGDDVNDPAKAFSPSHDIPALKQSLQANLDIPIFAMRSKGTPLVGVDKLKGAVGAVDLFGEPAINADVKAGRITAAGLSLAADVKAAGPIKGPLKAEISSKGSINSRIAAQWQPGEAKLSALEVMADLSSFLHGKTGKKMNAGIRAAQPATLVYGDRGIRVSGLDLRIFPSGRLRANGGLAPDKLDLAINLEELNFRPWQAIVPQLPAGTAAIQASLKGSPQKPAGSFRAGLNNVTVPKNPLPPVSLALVGAIEHSGAGSALKAKLELDPKTVKALGGNVAQVSASLPLVFGADGVPRPNMTGPMQAKVRWDGALGPIWNLLPIPDRRLNGRMAIDLNASGSISKPKVGGHAAIEKARYEDLLLGVLLTDINLRVDLSDAGKPATGSRGALDSLPGSMKLALNISDGLGGSVTASGGGRLDGNDLDIKAKISNLKPLRRRDIHIELSGNASVSGSATAPVIDGEIVVNKGEVLLNNIEMTGSVTTLNIANEADARKKAPPATAPTPAKESGRLNVRIVMLPRFSVEGRGLASLWQANLLVAGPLNDPKITGNISSVRGNFDFLGKIFALTRGVVFFGGGKISNPLVDIELTYDTPDLVAHIMVDGPVNKIRLSLTSDPSMPRDEIISRVLFGRSLNDLSRMEALQLAGAVAQLAGFGGGSSPLSFAKKALGVDVLRIGTANTGSSDQTNDSTGGGTTVEMGKYINDYIYMGIQQGFQADSTAFIIEIELTPRTNFELRTEQDNTWGGIKWKMNY